MAYEILEHTADLGLRIRAETLEGLFEDAAHGLIAVMGAAGGVPTKKARVDIEADDVEGLLVAWLSEVVFLFEARELVAEGFELDINEKRWRVTGRIRGSDTARFRQHGPQVKAATYHALRVEKSDEGYDARVYLDV